MEREKLLEFRHVSKSFPGVKALEDINVDLYPGEVHILVGENGAGKSTLMKVLSGAYTATSGELIFEGKRIEKNSPHISEALGISMIYQELNLIELAAWTHAEFVRIHPFPDGNGRTSRLIMNYQLLANGFPAISIAKEDRLEYFNTLEAWAVEKNLAPFADLVAGLTERQLDRYLRMEESARKMGEK